MAPISITLTGETWADIQAEAAAIAGATTTTTTITRTIGGTTGNTTTGETDNTTNTSEGNATSTGATTGVTNSAPTGSSTATPGSTTSSTPAIPSSGVAYPMPMPADLAVAAPVTLGTGPNTIVIVASNNPGSSLQNQFVVILEQGSVQTAIAGPLTVSSDVGASQAGSQVFTLKGTFADITGIVIVGVGNGLNGLWLAQVTLDFIPWYVNQDAANSRGTGSPSYGNTEVFNSNGTDMTFIPPTLVPTAPIPVPSAVATGVAGAVIDGTAVATATPLATLLTLIPTGGTLTLPAGTIVGSGGIPVSGTINGAGQGQTIIDATNFSVYQNKAALVPTTPGVTISNLTIKGAQIPASLGNNAAGLRDGAMGVGFTADAVEITGCQDGVLTFPSDVTMTNCTTHGNGAGDGFTHELYFGGSPTNTVNLNNHISICGAGATHALKSRAGTTDVRGGSFTGSSDPTGKIGGSVVDIPDAGAFLLSDATLIVSAAAANTLFLGYGMESALNAVGGLTASVTATLTNVVFTDNSGSGGQIQNGTANPNAILVLSNCTYTGAVAPQISGFATINGTISKAA